MVATDALCFMPWIAAEYGLRLGEDYQVRPSCFTGVGDKEDINKEVCWTQYGTRCNFSYVDPDTGEQWDRCRVWTQEGIAFNVHQCRDENVRYCISISLLISPFYHYSMWQWSG